MRGKRLETQSLVLWLLFPATGAILVILAALQCPRALAAGDRSFFVILESFLAPQFLFDDQQRAYVVVLGDNLGVVIVTQIQKIRATAFFTHETMVPNKWFDLLSHTNWFRLGSYDNCKNCAQSKSS